MGLNFFTPIFFLILSFIFSSNFSASGVSILRKIVSNLYPSYPYSLLNLRKINFLEVIQTLIKVSPVFSSFIIIKYNDFGKFFIIVSFLFLCLDSFFNTYDLASSILLNSFTSLYLFGKYFLYFSE